MDLGESSLNVHELDAAKYPWKALAWTSQSLGSAVTEKIDVAVTPTGRADALVALHNVEAGSDEKIFLQPASVELTIAELLSCLSPASQSVPGAPVYYLQSQNSNLTTTPLSALLKDLPVNFEFAKDVLHDPDARNIWIGTERSVTSVHRDPYENLYLVLRGSKTFRLWPPIDEPSMPTKFVRTGAYLYDASSDGLFGTKLDIGIGSIPWIDMDPLDSEDEQRLNAAGARMRTVTIHEGEMLYLPSGWYHHVSQECGHWEDGSVAPCIAINYWYDMDYEGEKYAMRQMVSRLVEIANGGNDPRNAYQVP